MPKLILLFVLVISLTSCGEKAFFSESYKFPSKQWTQRMKPKFVVNFTDTTQLYNFVLTLRTTTDYKFSNLWIFLNTTPPVGNTVREPYEIKTTFPDGSWIGKKSGSVVEHQLVFKRRKLPFKGKYTFQIEQGITDKSIDEVLDITFTVEKVE
ncbi:MAG: hypothetical protein RL264_1990 [Bacteroidota bacterium]